MSVERVRKYLKVWNKDSDIIELQVSTATSLMAAEALGVELGRIAKSMTLKTAENGLLLVTSGDTKVDNKKFKAVFGFNPKMLNAEAALELTGYQVGGICPFDIPSHVNVYLDNSLKRFESVYPACGSSSSMIRLTISELETYVPSKGWVNVCKISG